MALPIDGRTINNVLATTLDAQLSELTDNFFTTNPLIMRLLQRAGEGAQTIRYRGGAEIRSGIIYGDVPAGSYDRGQAFPTDQTEFASAMQFQWKRSYAAINVDHMDARKNMGDEVQIIDYVESLAKVASMSLRNKLGYQIYGTLPDVNQIAQTNPAISASDFDGLYNGVSNAGTYGGIVRGGNAGTPGFAIQSVVTAAGGAPVTKALVQSVFGKVTYDRERPDLILTTQNIWNELWERIEVQDRSRPGPLREAGFETYALNGAEVVADSHIQPGYLYMLNTSEMQLWLMDGVDFIRRGAAYGPLGFPIPNQDAFVDQIIIYGNLIIPGPRYQALITGIAE